MPFIYCMSNFQQPIRQGGFTVVNMGYDAKVSYGVVHVGRL